MTLASDVADFLRELKLDWLDAVYAGSIPQELAADTDSTVALVTEVIETPDEWNNNTFSALSQTAQVQIFYATNFGVPMQDVEVFLMKKFMSAGWTIAVSESHNIDPDTKQVFKTLQFERMKDI
ncbi:DUF806 family protein [Weissella cibaria]|uniref:DUF806 family protein n=1 Tax=Weissella cibaria TaxID=137591 RepID=UPI0007057DAA|nr:DUF806 family protein [Weissella cibaria]ALI33049.1 hypothetical protein AO080_06130 [Weissella cibaria]TVV29923.1 DUF806 family protein [Weissella cibaria]